MITLILATVVLLAAAACHDAAFRTVPNWIPAGIALTGMGLRLIDGQALQALPVALLVLAVTAALWLRGWMGGADVKLAAAVALALQPGAVLPFLILTCLFGGVLGLAYVLLSRWVPRPTGDRPRTLPARIARAERWRLSRRGPLPYAAAIAAAATLCILPLGH